MITENFVPAFFVNSEWKLVKDLSGLKDEDYYLFVMTSEDDINILTAGDYNILIQHRVEGWFDKCDLKLEDLIGHEGLSSIPVYYIINKDGNIIYEGDMFNERFNEIKGMIEQTKKTENDIIENERDGIYKQYKWSDYEVKELYALYYDGLIIGYYRSQGVIEFLFNSSDDLYNMTNHSATHPAYIRNKETKQEISYDEWQELYINNNYIVDDFEYYLDIMMHGIKKGNPITIE